MPAATDGEWQSSGLATGVVNSMFHTAKIKNAFGARDREQESLKIWLLQIVMCVCVFMCKNIPIIDI